MTEISPFFDMNGGSAVLERCSWRGALGLWSHSRLDFEEGELLHLEWCLPEEEEAALCLLPQGQAVFGAAQDWGAEPRQELGFGADQL